MKNLFSTIAIVAIGTFVIFTLSRCKKVERQYEVKGRLIDSCTNGKPLAGFTVSLSDVHKSGLLRTCTDNVDISTTTDSTGSFSLIYNSVCFSDPLQMDMSNKKGLIQFVENITTNKNINLGNIVVGNNVKYKIKIATDTTYSQADTLYYNIERKGSFDSTFRFIAGPFANNQVVDSLSTSLSYNAMGLDKPLSVATMRWILKSNSKVYKPLNNSASLFDFAMLPCGTNNEAVLQIGR
jgi:hypothetical protein